MKKIDLTISHDVIGVYHSLDFSDIRMRYPMRERNMLLMF